MSHTPRRVLLSVVFTAAFALLASACGIGVTFRAYLDTLWRPTLRSVNDLGKDLPREKSTQPYAGLASSGGSVQLQELRDTYRSMFPEQDPIDLTLPSETMARLRDMLNSFNPLNDAERDEVDLLRCKMQIIASNFHDPMLPAIQSCFETYLGQRHSAEWVSE